MNAHFLKAIAAALMDVQKSDSHTIVLDDGNVAVIHLNKNVTGASLNVDLRHVTKPQLVASR